MVRRISHVITLTIALAGFAGCGGSGIEAHYTAHATADAFASPDAAFVSTDAPGPSHGGPLVLESNGGLGAGAVRASSPQFVMVSTLGASFAAAGPAQSDRFDQPVDPR